MEAVHAACAGNAAGAAGAVDTIHAAGAAGAAGAVDTIHAADAASLIKRFAARIGFSLAPDTH
jgi:hypothetical protein